MFFEFSVYSDTVSTLFGACVVAFAMFMYWKNENVGAAQVVILNPRDHDKEVSLQTNVR